MLLYGCDFCGKVKHPADKWLLGVAAETVSPTSAHRTISMAAAWDDDRAVDHLAVHFCSVRCKDKYIAKLFDREPDGDLVEEETVELLPGSRQTAARKTPRRSSQPRGRKKKRAA
ncbi:MAG TPA: hypothetical protein VE994_07415 [Terriglobales bacterium]|nr:hypothetical protein [Terriglobales bacterium]